MNDAKYAAELVRRAKVISSARVSNPEVTDRAHRYRAQSKLPAGRAVCAWCGKKLPAGRERMIAHIDGNESNDHASNLTWTCRSCNTLSANSDKAAGRGRRTRQYNPGPCVPGKSKNPSGGRKASGAPNSGAWFQALETRHGRGDGSMTLEQAIQMIHDTPFKTRQKYNAKGTEAHKGRAKTRRDDDASRWD